MPVVGHGQMGLRSNMRIFDQLKNESISRGDAFVEIEGGALIADTWTPTGGAAGFEYAWDQDLDGEKLDVASVRTLDYPTLIRVETQAEVEATELTWQYDMTEGVLRVHLPDDADPTGVNVLVTTCFNFGTGGRLREHLVHPYLGTDAIVDGDFDESGLPEWNPTDTGTGFTVDRVAEPLVGGGYSALFEGDGSGSGSAILTQQPTSANAKARRLFGYYLTPADQPATAGFYVRVGTTTQMSEDGINPETLGDGLELTPTHGRTRAFCFDLISHEADAEVSFRLINSAATACSAKLDRVRMRPITGWRLFHPRVAAGGLPQSESGSIDVFPGSASTGSGSVKLMNDDKAIFERIFSGSPWSCHSRDVRIRYGGAFVDDHQEILYDDMFVGQSGIIAGDQHESVTDESATFAFEDVRNIFEALLPERTYGDFFGGEARDVSRPRVRFFGPQTHIRPSRIDVDGTTGLPIYEGNDPDYAAGAAFASPPTVYVYTDEEAAEADDTAKRITLTISTDFDSDPDLGQILLLRNPGVFVISEGGGPENQAANDRIDFTVNGVTYRADLTPGLYTSRTLELHAAAQMNAAYGGAGIVVKIGRAHV